MTSERTLLERIDAGAGLPAERSMHVDIGAATESVIAHLRQLLNVRQGAVEALPDYGMPDFNDIVGLHADHINVLQRGIREMIVRFEPRLSGVRVMHMRNDDDPLDMRFKVNARLVLDGEDTNIEIETLVGDGGRINVSG